MFRKVNPVWLTNPIARWRVAGSLNPTQKLVLILSVAILAATALFSGSESVQSAPRGFASRSLAAMPEGVPTCATPPPGMVSWWPLDETSGNTVVDIKGGHNGTTSASIGSDPFSASPPKVGNALSFV